MLQVKKYLQFIEFPFPSGKTKRFEVKNLSGESLGWVHWRSAWRRYVFGVYKVAEFDAGCLKEIIDFLDQLMNERKKKA